MDASHEGGCACGAVRYRLLSAPFDTGWCHCAICRRSSGAPAMVSSTVPAGDFTFTAIAWFETADDLPRHDRFRPDTRGLEGTEPPEG